MSVDQPGVAGSPEASDTPAPSGLPAGFVAEDFPILLANLKPGARRETQFRWAIRELSFGAVASSIRKVVFDEARGDLARVVDDAWEAVVSKPYVWNGEFESLPEPLQHLEAEISTMSLHDALSAHKKITRFAANPAHAEHLAHPAFVAMRSVNTEAHRLAEICAGLRAHQVKGRVALSASERAAKENPDKVVRTCSCCFRGIALDGQTMAHHGYSRPGHGEQTASCAGIRFQPLEVSDKGLRWRLENERAMLARDELALENVDSVKTLAYHQDRKPRMITPVDPEWKRTWSSYKAGLESDIRFGRSLVKELEGRLAVWVATEPEGLSSIPRRKRADEADSKTKARSSSAP